METIPSSEPIINNTYSENTGEVVKCGNCDYIGPGLKNRSLWAQIVSWIFVIISPLITMFYYILNSKYKCPKCKSDFIGIKDEEGVYRKPDSIAIVLFVVLGILMSIAVIGILSSVVLASLSVAREKGLEAMKRGEYATTTATMSTTTTINKKIDTSNNLSQDEVQAIVDYIKNTKKFPTEFDKNTTWLNISAEPNQVVKYEYNIHDLDMTGFSNDYLKTFVSKDACSNVNVKTELLDKGVTLRHMYTVKNSTQTFDFSIDKNDCK
jgi:hypothetical protein